VIDDESWHHGQVNREVVTRLFESLSSNAVTMLGSVGGQTPVMLAGLRRRYLNQCIERGLLGNGR